MSKKLFRLKAPLNNSSRALALQAGPLFRAVLLLSLNVPAHAGDAVKEALANGTVSLDLRLRYENVSLDIPNPVADEDEASGLTLRTRLGFQSKPIGGVSGYVEFEDVRTVAGVDDYAPETPDHAVIADPRVTELNQAFLHYTGTDALDGFEARFGRQHIIHDNARFVGNVGWRQDEQTFEAVRVDYSLDALALSAAYLTAVEGITPAFDADTQHRLFNATWKEAPFGSLTGYGYLLEPEDRLDAPSFDTLGLRYSAHIALEQFKLLGTVEYARQETDVPSGGAEHDTEYSLLEVGADFSRIVLKIAQETLGSDDGVFAFQTPLATKHAFNGWADKFLVTPDSGLVDRSLHLGGSLAGIALTARWHDFSSEEGDVDFGAEIDLQAVKKVGPYTLGLKYADYSADEYSVDTRKAWVWGEARF